MPLEKKPSEWRARVGEPGQCKKDSYYQAWPSKEDAGSHHPYNSKGIRALGCRKKTDNKSMIQSIRFSTKSEYKWTASKIRAWIKSHGYSLKGLYKVYEIEDTPLRKEVEHSIYIDSTEEFKIKSLDDDEKWIIRGAISSDQIDKHDEIVDPAALMRSKGEYMEFATVRYMHQAEPIGTTLKMWRSGNKVMAEVEIHGDESKIWYKIQKGYLRAFSIGFRVMAIEEYCPDGDEGECYIKFTKIKLIEISVVDSPANTDAIFEVKKQLKEIGGDALVNKMIIKAETYKCECIDCGHEVESEKHCKDMKCPKCGGEMRRVGRPGPGKSQDENHLNKHYKEFKKTPPWQKKEMDEEIYVEWEEDEEGDNMEGENMEESTEEMQVTEPVEDETSKEESSESEPETQTEEKETESEAEDEGKEDEMKGKEEEQLDFIPAEPTKEEEAKSSEGSKEIESLKSEISGIKESLAEIMKLIESIKEEKKQKEENLEKENEELKKKVEEKKLPKRQSYKDKNDAYDDKKDEKDVVEEAREVGKKQLKRLASTGYFE